MTWLRPGLLIPVLAVIAPLGAQTSPVTTDRPAITNASVTVPQGSVQVESGAEVSTAHSERTADGPQSLVVYGLTDATELRVTIPDYVHAASGSGFGDVALGVKQQVRHTAGGFDVSAIAFVSLPSGGRAVSSHGCDPGFQFPWSQKISANWTAAGMLSVYWPTEAGVRVVTGETTLFLDRQITGPWDAFAEYAGDFPEAGTPRHLIHVGTTYELGPVSQIDFHAGLGLSRAAVDHFIGVGYSFRFQARRK